MDTMALFPQENEPQNPNWGRRLKVTGVILSPFAVGFAIERLTGGTIEQSVQSGLLFGVEFWAAAAIIFVGSLLVGKK